MEEKQRIFKTYKMHGKQFHFVIAKQMTSKCKQISCL